MNDRLLVENIHVNYGGVHAVRGIGIDLEPGKILAIVGPNGAGKSSLLKAICGQEVVASGQVLWSGKPITGMLPHQILRAGISHVPEGRKVFAPLSVMENLLIGGHVTRSKADRRETLAQVFELFPILLERSHSKAGLLSGGEQQMLAFGRGLMSRPKVMLLDEPSLGLSPAMTNVVLSSVSSMASYGIAILMVEQNAQAAFSVADDCLVLEHGKVVFAGTPEEARQNDAVALAYLGT